MCWRRHSVSQSAGSEVSLPPAREEPHRAGGDREDVLLLLKGAMSSFHGAHVASFWLDNIIESKI